MASLQEDLMNITPEDDGFPEVDEVRVNLEGQSYKAVESFTVDLLTAPLDWAKGAYQGAAEIVRAKENVAYNTTAETLLAQESLDTETEQPRYGYTPEEIAANQQLEKAVGNFTEETIKPAAMTAAVVGTVPAAMAATGAASFGAAGSTLINAATAAYTPFMIEDYTKSVEQMGFTKATLETVKGINPFYSASVQIKDPNFRAWAQQHPGRAAASLSGDFMASAAPFVAPGIKLGVKLKKKTNKIKEKIVSPVEETDIAGYDLRQKVANQDHAEFIKNQPDEATVAQQEQARKDQMTPKERIAEHFDDLNNEISEDAPTPAPNNPDKAFAVNDGGMDIAIKPSTLSETVTRAQIMDTVNQITTTRFGKLRVNNKKVLGYFETMGEGIRVRIEGDFGTIAHEIGHYLDKVMEITGADNELINVAQKVWGESYKPDQRRAEGIAEFTRQYILNPDEAQKNFPEFSRMFSDTISNEPQLAPLISTLSDQMRKWYTQDGRARVTGAMNFNGEPKKNLWETVKDLKIKAETEFITKYALTKQIVDEVEARTSKAIQHSKNPFLQAEDLTSVIRTRIKHLTETPFSQKLRDTLRETFENKKLFAKEVFLADVMQALDNDTFITKYKELAATTGVKDVHQYFTAYLAARHLPDVHKAKVAERMQSIFQKIADIKNKVTLTDADHATLNRLYKTLDDIEQGKGYNMPFTLEEAKAFVDSAPPEIIHAAKLWDDFNTNFLQLAIHYGMISAKEAKYYKETYPHYSPLQRMMPKDEIKGSLTGGFHDNNLTNLDSVFKKLSETGSAKDLKDPITTMQIMTQQLIERGEKNRVAKLLLDLDKEFDGMSKYYMRVHGQSKANPTDLTFSVWRGGKEEIWQATSKEVYNLLNMPAEQAGGILSLAGQITTQALRIGATTTLDFGLMNAFRDTFTAAITSKSQKAFIPIIDTLRGLYLRYDKELYTKFDIAGVTYAGYSKNYLELSKNIRKKMGVKDGWETAQPYSLGMWALEKLNIINQAIEEAPRLVEFARLLEEGYTLNEAGHHARDLTTNFSRSGTMGAKINKYDAFFNATIQGNNKLWRAFKEDPQRFFMKVSTNIILPSILLWKLNHREEWYKTLAPDIKNNNWVFKVGDRIYRIPKPQGAGVLFGSLPERILDYCVDTDTKVPDTLAPFIATSMLPSHLPNIVVPLIEWTTNYSLFMDKPIVSQQLQKLPTGLQADQYTSNFSRTVGKATRGTWVETSPKKLDNAITTIFGGWGKTFLNTTDTITGKEVYTKVEQYPILNRFMVDPTKRPAPVNYFYEHLDDMRKEHNGTGKSTKSSNLQGMEATYKKITELNREIRNIEANKNLNKQQKTTHIENRKKQILTLAKRANSKYTGYKYND